MKTLSFLAAAAFLTLLPAAHAQQALTVGPKHRYRFDNPSGVLAAGAQITDSIGTAHGFIRGSGASGNGDGVRLAGGASDSAAYIDLPNASVSGSAEMFPGLSEASYEVWVTVHSNRNWSRILDFGNNSIDEVIAPGGTFNGADYLIVSANVGTSNTIRFERGGQFLTGGGLQDISGATVLGTRMHLVATYDNAASAWKLYKNGTQIASVPTLLGPSTLDDLNVWLGRSNWAADSNVDATYDEFRSYDYALSAQQVLGNYQAGPDVVNTATTNQAPVFASNPLVKQSGFTGTAYSGTIGSDASDPNPADLLTFSKTGGPAWLSVAANGALSGTPPVGSGGLNSFTVRATDPGGLYAETTLEILVNNGLPANWASSDIGAVGVAGSATEGGGTYTISGSGSDIWDTADSFRFAWQSLAGDGEIRARITSQANSDPWAQAGVMIRDGSAAGAMHAMMVLTPSNGFSFQWRGTTGGTTSFTAGPASGAPPNNWVRLTRSGNLITAYVSANGTAWTQVGSTTLSLPASTSIGLAVTSHNNAVLGSASFDNVAITPFPVPWSSTNIGSTGLQGGAEYFGSAFTVKGAGTFGGANDAFRYVYRTLSGDGTLIARISTLQDTGTSARVGIMMRDTLAVNSRMAALTVNGSGAWRWQRRGLTGGAVSTTNSSSGTAPNLWVRLVRSGNTVTAYRSTNGTAWTSIGSSTVTMASTCYVGLAVASGSTATLNTSVLDNVSLMPVSPILPAGQDEDNDGLADAWESQYYPPSQYGPSEDPDADGISNRDELVSGTDPLNGSDAPQLRIMGASPAVFSFDGKAGRIYSLERTANSAFTDWQGVQTVGPLSADGPQQLGDPSPLLDRGIYRLRIELPGSP